MSAAGVGSGDTGEAIGLNGRAQLYNVSSSTANTALYNDGGYHRDSGNFTAMIGVGNYQASTAAHTAVKILFTSGNIESGEITMFGIVNS
jgi:hypothetical protein